MEQRHLVGLDYLEAITTLLQRGRAAHPTKGLYEAAEMQWWWTRERSTDAFPQLFWFDSDGQPTAAVTVNDFGDASSLVYSDPILVVSVMADAEPEWLAHIVENGLAHLAEHGIDAVEIEIDQADDVMREVMTGNGFTRRGDAVVECWLDASAQPEISPLPDGYQLLSRPETAGDRPHHMATDSRPDPELRLSDLSLYRPEFDLAMFDENGNYTAQAMFWHDPVTATGVVEPVRTQDEHQGRGLSRHLLTTGVDLLAQAGAKRISIGYEPDNPASGHLYRSIGFEPHRQTDLYSNAE